MASAKLSQTPRSSVTLERDELERLVNDVVKYLLIVDQKKLPIKKADINKNVLKENSKAFPQVILEAGKRLKTVFGIKLCELEEKQKGCFILVNKLPATAQSPNTHIKWSEEEESKHGLLLIVLSIVFMGGNVITDNQLWSALKKFGIDQDFMHEVFGDVKKLILQEWVRQGYLEITRQPAIDPPLSEVRWGQRAHLETSKRSILQFVSKIYGIEELSQWTSQWQDVLQSEGEEQPGPSQPTTSRPTTSRPTMSQPSTSQSRRR